MMKNGFGQTRLQFFFSLFSLTELSVVSLQSIYVDSFNLNHFISGLKKIALRIKYFRNRLRKVLGTDCDQLKSYPGSPHA